MRTLYFDCFCGASGDMILGALVDLGADFDTVQTALASLNLSGYRVSAGKVKKHGIMATQFCVEMDPDTPQPHRHLADVLGIIEQGGLPDSVAEAAAETFRRIAAVEAQVHGTTPEKIHFHEVGAVDSIVDIMGAHVALDLLGVDRVCASPLTVGTGTVECEHGILPVPAPATALLLEGVPCSGGDVQAELLTPTGAALLTQLASEFGPMPEMRIKAVGYGCGTRDLEDRPNVLRCILGETVETIGGEPITVVECNVDDMTPELLAALVADLLEAGARDAFLTPLVCKKGRPGYLITALCDGHKLDAVTTTLFRGSTTFGLRMRQERRTCLDREWKTVETPWGNVRIKIGHYQGQPMTAAPEFEDCRKLALEAGVSTRAVFEAAQAAAQRNVLNRGNQSNG